MSRSNNSIIALIILVLTFAGGCCTSPVSDVRPEQQASPEGPAAKLAAVQRLLLASSDFVGTDDFAEAAKTAGLYSDIFSEAFVDFTHAQINPLGYLEPEKLGEFGVYAFTYQIGDDYFYLCLVTDRHVPLDELRVSLRAGTLQPLTVEYVTFGAFYTSWLRL